MVIRELLLNYLKLNFYRLLFLFTRIPAMKTICLTYVTLIGVVSFGVSFVKTVA